MEFDADPKVIVGAYIRKDSLVASGRNPVEMDLKRNSLVQVTRMSAG